MIIVSACLLGLNTKYDGTANAYAMIQKYSSTGQFIPVCPEQLGGLSTPRVPVEIIDGTGQDVLDGRCEVQGLRQEATSSVKKYQCSISYYSSCVEYSRPKLQRE
ncbi:MAG TPA: DUF523 domain-containing protein [Desulfosporosinus sp.]|nr:DUF523 domain-containing protein [Desulfosporosinus sp.]